VNSAAATGLGCGITVRANMPLTSAECIKASGPTYFVLANSCAAVTGYTTGASSAADTTSSNTILGYPAASTCSYDQDTCFTTGQACTANDVSVTVASSRRDASVTYRIAVQSSDAASSAQVAVARMDTSLMQTRLGQASTAFASVSVSSVGTPVAGAITLTSAPTSVPTSASSSSGLSGGAIVGIIIGALVGVAIVVGVIYYVTMGSSPSPEHGVSYKTGAAVALGAEGPPGMGNDAVVSDSAVRI